MIYDSILGLIGQTPIVHLQRLSAKLGCEIYAKLESMNPGGSHKARIALGMVLNAEARGILRRNSGQTIVEPSGGNTGIGLAMAAAHFGYRLVLVIPDNYSVEKQRLLKLYGAEIILSDSRLGNNSHGEKALALQLEHPEWVMLNQQRNPANPEAHRTSTALEILQDFAGRQIDYFIGGIGTGGHITGIGQILRKHIPNISVIGVEPQGCRLLEGIHRPHRIQGLSIGLRPAVLDIDVLDEMIQVSEEDCLRMARTVISLEAISIGISSAANFAAVEKLILAGRLSRGSSVLTVVYDSIESYLSYFDQPAPSSTVDNNEQRNALSVA